MRKYIASLFIIAALSCTKDSIEDIQYVPNESLSINLDQGIKLESYIVKSDVLMNLKVNKSGSYVVVVKDIDGDIVSKEDIDLRLGSNIHKLYIELFPISSYTVEFIDGDNKLIGTELFSMKK